MKREALNDTFTDDKWRVNSGRNNMDYFKNRAPSNGNINIVEKIRQSYELMQSKEMKEQLQRQLTSRNEQVKYETNVTYSGTHVKTKVLAINQQRKNKADMIIVENKHPYSDNFVNNKAKLPSIR